MGNPFNLLWPMKKQDRATTFGRLGRVLHWSLTFFAALAAVMVFSYLRTASVIDVTAPAPGGWESSQAIADWHFNQGTKWILYALGAFFAGRALRYVLSAE
jgi:hypothetical protein